MSYRCEACSIVVPPGVARKVHTIYQRELYKSLASCQIVREVPVCAACKHLLDKGKTLADLQKRGLVEAQAKSLAWLEDQATIDALDKIVTTKEKKEQAHADN